MSIRLRGMRTPTPTQKLRSIRQQVYIFKEVEPDDRFPLKANIGGY
jgi:hypothetical protein